MPVIAHRSVVSIPNGPSTIAVRDCAYGLAKYAAIAQVSVSVRSSQASLLTAEKRSPVPVPFSDCVVK